MRQAIIILFCLQVYSLQAQFVHLEQPDAVLINRAPDWAQHMYLNTASISDIDQAFQLWRNQHPADKNYHTQYYKRWRRMADLCKNESGFFDYQLLGYYYATPYMPDASGSRSSSGNWSAMGPMQTYRPDGTKENDQTNVYSITQCSANLNILYCGTEPGEVYKSTDGGNTWAPSSSNYFFNGVEAIAVDPTNPDVVYAANGYNLMKSEDGGATWLSTLYDINLWPHEIIVHPSESQIVVVAAESGVFRTDDGGDTWTEVSTGPAWDLKWKPGSTDTLYLLKRNSAADRSEFFISPDKGISWMLKDNGWYNSTDPDRYDGGSRLAVSNADPNRVYAYLIGDSKADDHGYIGVYRSDDGGETWYLPNGPVGGPYDDDHINLAIGWVGWDYHQGFYNCAIAASPENADEILVGGLNLYKSTDGGFTFFPVAGYVGGYLPIHVDMQDFRVTEAGTWITNDGGITFSDNFYTSSFDIKMQGLHGADYWGFGTGWNHDVHVGGLYHNGNLAWYSEYGDGSHMQLGGAEPPSGYVNPGNNFKVYSSELGAVTIPESFGGSVLYGGLGLAPNESYWAASSSEMEFHPACYSIAYVGRDNKLWKSEDAGASFNLLYTFPGAASAEVRYFEIGWSNPDVMYLSQAPSGFAGTGKLWKSTDGGLSFSELSVPGSGSGRDRILLALDPEDDASLYLAYPGGDVSNKVFHSIDGGISWQNISGSVFSGHEIRSIMLVPATNGGLYAATNYDVFYRDQDMDDWSLFDNGLPFYANANIIKPFFRDAKIRMATYGKGVWESPLEVAPAYPVAQPMVDKLKTICPNEAFYFEDHSILVHEGATWSWTFDGGTPSSSVERNPIVYFDSPGSHEAALTVTDAFGNSSTASVTITVSSVEATSVAESFEGVFPPFEWTTQGLNSGVSIWNKSDAVGAFGLSASSAVANNYWSDLQGGYGDLRAFVNLSESTDQWLTFDVAYAPYGGIYIDTLAVLVSTDCGETFTELYRKGGMDLATSAPYTPDVFVPEYDEWRTDSISLSAFAENENVMVAFRNIGYWGQALYIDQVNINGLPLQLNTVESDQQADIAPTLLSNGEAIHIRSAMPDQFLLSLYSMDGKLLVQKALSNNEPFVFVWPAGGTYLYMLESQNYLRTGKLMVQ